MTSGDASHVRLQTVRHLRADRLAGEQRQLLLAPAGRPGPDAGAPARAGDAGRLRPGWSGGDGCGVQRQVRTGQAALAAVPELPRRRRATRLQLLRLELPAHGHEHAGRRAAVDDRLAVDDNAARIHDRHDAGGHPGLARRAALAALCLAAAHGIERGPVLPAWADPDLPGDDSVPLLPAVRWL